MSMVKRKSRRKLQSVEPVLARYWAGDPPPDGPGTFEERDKVWDAWIFGDPEYDDVKATWHWGHHPHRAAWSAWVGDLNADRNSANLQS